MDLLSLALTLRPLGGGPEGLESPPWWGRAAHALLLDVVRSSDPAVAEKLHGDEGLRPFTVSSLMGRFREGRLDPERTYSLRLTAFRDDLASLLWESARAGRLAPGSQVELAYQPFRVESVLPDRENPGRQETGQSSWAGTDSFQELSAPLLMGKVSAPRRVDLLFTSPTTFKSGGKHVPLPLPDLVFGSLLERWNAFAPITFPAELKRYAAECLAIRRYRLSSRLIPAKGGGLRVGGVGQIGYLSLSYDRYWMSVIAVLAAFALYSGVGAGTGLGLGQCRQVNPAPEVGPPVAAGPD